MTKRITYHFDLEEKDYPSYVRRTIICMEKIAKEGELGCGKPLQTFYYPEGTVTVEWLEVEWPTFGDISNA